MGTSNGNFVRKLTGFYDNLDRKQKWRQTRIDTNEEQAIINFDDMLLQLQSLNIDEKWFEQQLIEYRITKITKMLRSMNVKHPKLATSYLKRLLGPKVKEIGSQKRRSRTSNTLKNRLKTDIDLKTKFINQLIKYNHNHKYYKSKGELKLKQWLQDNYAHYDWTSIHLRYKNSIYEFDIYSRQYNDFFIEYNGACHYKQIYSLKNLERIQKRDKEKIQVMKELNKEFLVIKDFRPSIPFEEQTKAVVNFFKLSNSLKIK